MGMLELNHLVMRMCIEDLVLETEMWKGCGHGIVYNLGDKIQSVRRHPHVRATAHQSAAALLARAGVSMTIISPWTPATKQPLSELVIKEDKHPLRRRLWRVSSD